jgi:ZIP family zinc transporter
MFETHTIIQAFLLTLFAGLATGIGGLIALRAKSTNTTFLAVSLGFSAGVMIYVSFVEIFPTGMESIAYSYGEKTSSIIGVFALFSGIAVAALIDFLIPEAENPHEHKDLELSSDEKKKIDAKSLYRVGIMSTIIIAIHNFPEGIATFVASLSDPQLGISIALAIALHNIPEGIVAYVPIYYATKNKKKALLFSFLTGLAEPLGALIAFLVLMPFLNDTVLGIIFCAIAGIMIFISIDELLPTAHEYGQHHHIIYAFIAGMALMAISLVFI